MKVWRRVLVGLVGLAIAAAGAAWVRSLTQPERLLPVGTPVQFDDFAFTVTGSREMIAGEGEKATRFLVVALRVDNRARRVTYPFRRSLVSLVDDDGREQGVSPAGQRTIDGARVGPDPLVAPIPAGASGTTELAFAMPERSSNLRIRIGDSIFNVLDDLLQRKPRLKVR